MPPNREPIRVVEGKSKPHARFWNWVPKNEADKDSVAEIQFYGYISEYSWWGDEITPKKFAKDLAKYGGGEPITVRIHSGGGDMLAASAIRAMLSDYDGLVTSRIDGLCASAAVAIALAGDEVKIQDSAYMMIHNPGYTILLGFMDAEYLRALSDDLDKFAESLVGIYARRTGQDEDKINEMMAAETWLTADEAVGLGFADDVIHGGVQLDVNASVKNIVNMSVNVPDDLLSPPRLSEEAEQLRARVQNILNKE